MFFSAEDDDQDFVSGGSKLVECRKSMCICMQRKKSQKNSMTQGKKKRSGQGACSALVDKLWGRHYL